MCRDLPPQLSQNFMLIISVALVIINATAHSNEMYAKTTFGGQVIILWIDHVKDWGVNSRCYSVDQGCLSLRVEQRGCHH